ncbi:hypothetical protein QJS04_geneDACA014925 [Acorus gramineus]|uniref:DUF4283 domain-containing protein n=1 Tax=Acorus gramineus TaxID=55184 RepID=A0AAV9BXW9_ACOGR|nr:hypothetical protein QJS04_geneDACA014925 [Acorus gramineus]
MDGSQKVAIIEEEEAVEAEESWGHILVGYVWGKNPIYTPFVQFLHRLWNLKGVFTFSMQGNGFFMILLTKVLEGGPCSMDNRPFVIQRWTRNTKIEFERLSSIPVWIKFPNLPLHFWSKTCIGKIASLLGNPLYLDTPTALQSRTAYARVCVEVEASGDLPDEVFVEIRNGDRVAVRVTYDWKPMACEHCNTVGHESSFCCKKPCGTKVAAPAGISNSNVTAMVHATMSTKDGSVGNGGNTKPSSTPLPGETGKIAMGSQTKPTEDGSGGRDGYTNPPSSSHPGEITVTAVDSHTKPPLVETSTIAPKEVIFQQEASPDELCSNVGKAPPIVRSSVFPFEELEEVSPSTAHPDHKGPAPLLQVVLRPELPTEMLPSGEGKPKKSKYAKQKQKKNKKEIHLEEKMDSNLSSDSGNSSSHSQALKTSRGSSKSRA